MNFPPFDGENPKLWLGCCLDYFDMYTVPHHRWVKVATMHMTAAAARWFQSVEDQVRQEPGNPFVRMSWSALVRISMLF